MKKLYPSISAFLFFTTIFSCSTSLGVKRYYNPVKITRILDYNRLEVKLKKKYIKIKLIGVYVPRTKKVKRDIRKYKIPKEYHRNIFIERRRAASFLERSLMEGDVVYIEAGFKKKDKYGNYLAYLYMPNHAMLNEEFISKGYSMPYTSKDNIKYQERFYSTFIKSIKRRNGLWRLWEKADKNVLRSMEAPSVEQATPKAYKISGMRSISIMTFNVENLFDTSHDPAKNDYEYLPISQKNNPEHRETCWGLKRSIGSCLNLDWSKGLLRKKMQRLARTILSYNNGKGPDILILQEVENFGILNRLRKKYLAPARYLTAVLIDGKDFRGIDIGILSRLPLSSKPVLHKIPFKSEKSSRGILQVTLRIPGNKRLTIFGFHFPSQAHKTTFRIQAMKYLNKLKSKLPDESLTIAAGDCNITSQEEKNERILDKYTLPKWLLSHRIGSMKNKSGTYFHDIKQWAFFDIILFSKNLMPGSKSSSGWEVIPGSIEVITSYPPQLSPKGTPQRFKMKGYKGVSDHFPLAAKIKLI